MNNLLRRQYDEMVSENARLTALLDERDAEIAAVRAEVGGDENESLLDAVSFWLVEHEHYSKLTEKYGQAIRGALYDYDHGDELGAIDRLRAALAVSGEE